MSHIYLYDTTLRDGTQREGISYSLDDKLKIAARLDAFGMDYIEGGWPGSNPKDAEFFERARDLEWKNALIAAFGSTCRVKGGPEDDANIQALLEARTPVCTLFGKTWNLHVTEVLLTTLDDNLRIIEQSIAHLRAAGRRVIYDAEHFFDGYKEMCIRDSSGPASSITWRPPDSRVEIPASSPAGIVPVSYTHLGNRSTATNSSR